MLSRILVYLLSLTFVRPEFYLFVQTVFVQAILEIDALSLEGFTSKKVQKELSVAIIES
jgi:hypothetical protein